MLDMLIVDDNNRDRRVLQQILPWEDYGIRIVGAAADGMEALEMVRQNPPDIIITDISMPRLNGLDFARELEVLSPSTRVIFLSCYNDFEYAKQAVNLNVFGYINKPLNQEELGNMAERVSAACQEQMSREQKYRDTLQQFQTTLPLAQEEFFRELLLDTPYTEEQIIENARFLEIPLNQASCLQVAALKISEDSAESRPQEQYFRNYDLRRWVSQQDKIAGTKYLIRVSPIEYALVMLLPEGGAGESDKRMLELTSELVQYCTDQYGVDVTIGISKPTDAAGNLPELYRQSMLALRSNFYTVGLPILLYRDIEDGRESEPPAFSEQEWSDELRNVIDSGNEEEVNRFVDHYFSAVGRRFPELFYKQRAFSLVGQLFVILAEQSFSFFDIHSGPEVMEKLNGCRTLYELNSWLRELLLAAIALIHGENASRNEKLVGSIKKVIHTRYHEQITAEEIAKCVYLSTKQANNIFRRETGKTIFDYLVEYRIEVAKKLLRDPNNRIYWVAEQVGYQNKSYFALVFKKLTGLTPIDYRNQSK